MTHVMPHHIKMTNVYDYKQYVNQMPYVLIAMHEDIKCHIYA